MQLQNLQMMMCRSIFSCLNLFVLFSFCCRNTAYDARCVRCFTQARIPLCVILDLFCSNSSDKSS